MTRTSSRLKTSAQTIFMAKLTSAVTSANQSGSSKSSIISEVLKLYDSCTRIDEPKILNEVHQTNVVITDDVELENNNVSPIKQHVDHNKESDVSSRASSVVCDKNVLHEQRIYSEVQQTNVVETNNEDMGNTNFIPYEHYVKNNAESVVPNNESSADPDICELNEYIAIVPDDTLTTRIKILKDQVTIYQQRAKFELTEREQKMDW